MITQSENDTREIRIFKRFLIERGTHQELQRTLKRKLPFQTTTVPNEWWDPRGEFTPTDSTKEPSK